MRVSPAGRFAVLDDPDLVPVLAALPRARLVGGCVRDSLANRPVADIDLATPDRPDGILDALAGAGIRAVPTGVAHGTVTAIIRGRPFEITTLRRDREADGRHAVVDWTDDFAEDAARRDFTINAMSVDQAGVLHDYFGGCPDLAAGRVRFVGRAALRVEEDHLRILRFFRFFARYGTEPPDAEAVSAIAAASDSIARLSAERVWSEVKRILAVPSPWAALALMDALGVLRAALPGVALTVLLPLVLLPAACPCAGRRRCRAEAPAGRRGCRRADRTELARLPGSGRPAGAPGRHAAPCLPDRGTARIGTGPDARAATGLRAAAGARLVARRGLHRHASGVRGAATGRRGRCLTMPHRRKHS